MTHALFELDTIQDLPLWAQVLIASRMTRRAVLWLPAGVPQSTFNILLPGCDALDRCARAGENLTSEKEAIRRAQSFQPVVTAADATWAMQSAVDAALAAEAALDFAAAQTACINSTRKAVTAACGSPHLTPLQGKIFAAADLDLLRFACDEFRIERYAGLGDGVMSRLLPINPPDRRAPPKPDPDPTRGAR